MRILPGHPALSMLCSASAATLFFAAAIASAQTTAPALGTVAPFDRPSLGRIPVIQQTVRPSKPLTITGARGAILGEQSGVVELWQLPVKVFSNLRLRAALDGYTVPLDLNPGAATVEVRPGHTVLTYSFAGITVRQHMLVSPAQPQKAGTVQDDPGALLYFEIDSVRPATLTISLTPAMQQQWPAPQYGQPGASWVPMPETTSSNTTGSSPAGTGGGNPFPGGAYMVATDNPALFGMIGMPNSKPGDIPVYQEHPQTLPLQFLVRYDPAHDRGRLFPLLSTVAQTGETNSPAAQLAMRQRLAQQAQNLPQLAQAIDDDYAHFFDHRLTVHTPDARFDEALRWAELSIDDAQVEHRTMRPDSTGNGANQTSETGLVAGWFPSYDSTRPGFGWYFGRDTLWSLYAIDSYGDGALSKRALEFLLRRQRADGKMMHEFSQMADDLPPNLAWSNFGYEYAAADATPLFLMALLDYVRTTGDTAFLRDHWEQAKRAYRFERTHDSDGDGVYDNSQGTGWVENWQSPMPHQELYLASLDQQATAAMADLARLQHDENFATEATETAAKLTAAVETYRDASNGLYAFSKNSDGTFDRTLTVYPAVALWNPAQPTPPSKDADAPPSKDEGAPPSPRSSRLGWDRSSTTPGAPCPASGTWVPICSRPGLAHPEAMLHAWSSHLLATDWGTRAVATDVSFYDPISYHMGSVWPLFTGWNAMAQYRTQHPAAGWITLQQNLRLTWAEDPGTVTELLSGQFYQPLGRSSAHQLWSSAMTLAPAIRGLFGIDVDTTRHALNIHPQLPVQWEGAELDNVRVGSDFYHVTLHRTLLHKNTPVMKITVTSPQPTGLCLNLPGGTLCKPTVATMHETTVPLPRVEIGLHNPAAPQPGDETHLPHITDENYAPDRVDFKVQALANTTVYLDVRSNGKLDPKGIGIAMPNGNGFLESTFGVSSKSK